MTIHPLFTVHTLGHFTCSPTYWISSKRCVPYIKTFSTLSGIRTLFWILPQLDILCTSAVKRYYAKNDNSSFKYHLFSRVLEFMKARKTCHRVVRTSIWSIPYSGELCNKNCIAKTSVWIASCYTAGSGKWDAIKGVSEWLLKRAATVFSVQYTCWICVDLLMLVVSNDC